MNKLRPRFQAEHRGPLIKHSIVLSITRYITAYCEKKKYELHAPQICFERAGCSSLIMQVRSARLTNVSVIRRLHLYVLFEYADKSWHGPL